MPTMRILPIRPSYKGHFYSDKAPGTVVLALPSFALALLLRPSNGGLDSDAGRLLSSWIACAGSVGIIAGLGAALMYAWLAERTAPKPALLTTLAIFLGAAPLPYSTMMFSHALTVGLVTIAAWAMHKAESQIEALRQAPTKSGPRIVRCFIETRWEMVAGLACGWTLASEYTAGIAIVGLFVWFMREAFCLRKPTWPRGIAFWAAAVPPLLLIPLYSFLCFGNPMILPYSLNSSFPEMRQGLYAIKWPDAQTAYNLLFSPTRGLFFWTPFLAMAAFGYGRLFRVNRPLFWLTYAVPLLQVVVISGRAWDWQAGPTLGPRYLAPILPLLALPCALGVQRFPRLAMLLAGYSILITTVATLSDACPPASYYNPLIELHIPLLLRGELSPNLGMLLGLSPHASVVLYYGILAVGIAWLWRTAGREDIARNGGVSG